MIDGNPFMDVAVDGSTMLALFLSASPDPRLSSANDPTTLDPAHVRLDERVIYQQCPHGILEAPDVGGFITRHFKITVTGRNWNTVTELGALLDP